MIRLAVLLGILFNCLAPAADWESRAKLNGTWQLESGGAQAPVWSLQEDGDKIRVVHSEGSQAVLDFECTTMGKQCEVKDDGHEAKVSMWYNGPKLVQMETRGNDVVKRRFSVPGDGETLEIEIIPIAPSGKTETLRLKRVDTSAPRAQASAGGAPADAGAGKR